jgi:hypothetical protein
LAAGDEVDEVGGLEVSLACKEEELEDPIPEVSTGCDVYGVVMCG